MDVFEEVRKYYEEAIDWEPDVKRSWIEEYLKFLENQGKSQNILSQIWDDINAFSFYQDRSEHHDLSELPYWEYSVCLEWIDNHVLSREYTLNLKNAKRLLGNLLDFYKFLLSKGHIENYTELEKAFNEICGGKKLNLVKRVPYTGKELWTSMSVPSKQGRNEESFTMSDYWLIILYMSTKRSWNHLKEVAKSSKSPQKKIMQINDLQRKLKNIGYFRYPEKLLLPYGAPADEDLDDASNWFFHK
jgi:hypothetical protein